MSTTTIELADAERASGDHAPEVVHLSHIGKRFGEMAVVQDVSLSVERGRIFGMIGASGCGKTTIVRIMAGLIAPTMGEVTTFGIDPATAGSKAKSRIGYMPQGFVLYPSLSVLQNARFVAGLYGVSWFKRGKRIRELLERFDLWDARDRKARDLSGGMQRRLQLACALVHSPELLFVDEPTAGLDPVLRISIWRYLNSLRDEGMTIVMTTQFIDEAEHCDMLALINHGEATHVGTPEELKRLAVPGDTVEVQGGPFSEDMELALAEIESGISVRRVDDTHLMLHVPNAGTAIPSIVSVLDRRGARVECVVPQSLSFDEAFTRLVENDV
jgi:ABC-2 type transport system ATP-binding protein